MDPKSIDTLSMARLEFEGINYRLSKYWKVCRRDSAYPIDHPCWTYRSSPGSLEFKHDGISDFMRPLLEFLIPVFKLSHLAYQGLFHSLVIDISSAQKEGLPPSI